MLRLFNAMVLGALLFHGGGLRLEFVEVWVVCCSGAALWFLLFSLLVCWPCTGSSYYEYKYEKFKKKR